ncbi:PHP domain-containing protein [Halanaerobiaceae bacterium Z-7014]|uniref:PHP domain-containing protein n=1 Tax=Halonatronomonas betaini TaxID=2778430 RepID=A0A931AZQ7_9FIRM|nr:PHP domain-containing protein [Halonatronomonas betaini]MBF8437753.1 PHP domain-containing protein [Halonatronomonas betaini]
MLNFKADLHIHSIASGHAYSSITELARAAADKKYELIAITDHGPEMPGSCHSYHFGNLKALPAEIHGVKIISGVEANIGPDGSLDLGSRFRNRLDFITAGIHDDALYVGEYQEDCTRAIISAIESGEVDMITHPVSNFNPVNIEEVAAAASRHQVILEINASSYSEGRSIERGNLEKDIELCRLAIADPNLLLALNSDAHYHDCIGYLEPAIEIINKSGISPDRFINYSADKFIDYLKGE